eukprot:gene10317-11388_t
MCADAFLEYFKSLLFCLLNLCSSDKQTNSRFKSFPFPELFLLESGLQKISMDVTKYFTKTTNDKMDGRALNASIPGSSSSSVLSAARELNTLQEKQEEKKKRQVLPEKIKKEVAYHALKHGNPEARRWALTKYPNFTFKRETVRDCKAKYQRTLKVTKEKNTLLYVVKDDRQL